MYKAPVEPRRLGILPGTFNPPTCAHLALAQAALPKLDEVLFVIPRVFPHKDYAGATLEQRLAMLRRAVAHESRFSIGISDGGLFVDIGRESRRFYPEANILFLCGRDAAERIVNWDYGDAGPFASLLEDFSLLVANRNGRYDPPEHLAHRVELLACEDLDEVSSTEVRNRIATGAEWRHLVPDAIADEIAAIWKGGADASMEVRKPYTGRK